MAMPSDVSVAIIDDHELVREGLSTLVESPQVPIGRVVYCGESPVDAAAASPVVALLDVDLRVALNTVALGELYLSVDLAAILASAADTPELSPRELDVLRLYASGLKLTAVANQLGISPHTAKEYLDRVRAKYAQVGRTARTRTELYAAANRDGLLESDR